ncbi:MAG: HEAT repeat domain-containing protein, partial [Candidatus Muiribacteriota bacterium]
MNRRRKFILKALSNYHFSNVIEFFKNELLKSDYSEKKSILDLISNTSISEEMSIEFLSDLFDDEKELEIKIKILKIIGKKNISVFNEKYSSVHNQIQNHNNYLVEVIDYFNNSEQVDLLISLIKNNKNIDLQMKILEKLAGVYSEEVKNILKIYIKHTNELIQLAIIRGIESEKYIEFLVQKAYSGNPTIEITALSKLGKIMTMSRISVNTKKNIINLISDKLNSSEEIIKLAAIKTVNFYDKKLFKKMLTMWDNIHPFYFPVLKESIMNMVIMCTDNSATMTLMEELNIFKIRNFVNTLYKMGRQDLLLFIYQNYKKNVELDDFLDKLKNFFIDNKIFSDQRFYISFFKELEETEMNYFRTILEKIFMREFSPFRFKENDIKIISEYLDILGLLSIKFSEHFFYINYDYVRTAILKFVERNEDNFSYLIECAKYKSDVIKETAIYALGEYEQSVNFLSSIYKNSSEFLKITILKALSLGKSNSRKMFFLGELSKEKGTEKILNELLENITAYYDDDIVFKYAQN